MTVVLKKYQTLLDFATQNAGSAEELFNVAIANNIGITDLVNAGTALTVEAVDLRVTKFFTGAELDITTLPKNNVNGGIGYMQIGTDFKVS